MTRIGKIARLPVEIREQLNTRLRDGESGRKLIRWLNELRGLGRDIARLRRVDHDGLRLKLERERLQLHREKLGNPAGTLKQLREMLALKPNQTPAQ